MREIRITPVRVDGEVRSGQKISELLKGVQLADGDVVVVSQKIVSKSEGRVVRLDNVNVSVLAGGLAAEYGKDDRIVELVISEAQRIVRIKDGIIITQTRHGFVCANSGVDESNVEDGYAVLLPEDPDASARAIRADIVESTGADVGVVISDTFGRAFRMGQTDCAIGCAGVEPMTDYAGTRDTFGRVLHTTLIAVADELAGAAELVMRKLDRTPIAVISGAHTTISDTAGGAVSMNRSEQDDLFR